METNVTKLKLSEAIRIGCKELLPSTGEIISSDLTCGCVMGAALVGAGMTKIEIRAQDASNHNYDYFDEKFGVTHEGGLLDRPLIIDQRPHYSIWGANDREFTNFADVRLEIADQLAALGL